MLSSLARVEWILQECQSRQHVREQVVKSGYRIRQHCRLLYPWRQCLQPLQHCRTMRSSAMLVRLLSYTIKLRQPQGNCPVARASGRASGQGSLRCHGEPSCCSGKECCRQQGLMEGRHTHLCSQGLIKGETGLGLAKRIPGKENSQHADGDSKDSRSRHGVGVALHLTGRIA